MGLTKRVRYTPHYISGLGDGKQQVSLPTTTSSNNNNNIRGHGGGGGDTTSNNNNNNNSHHHDDAFYLEQDFLADAKHLRKSHYRSQQEEEDAQQQQQEGEEEESLLDVTTGHQKNALQHRPFPHHSLEHHHHGQVYFDRGASSAAATAHGAAGWDGYFPDPGQATASGDEYVVVDAAAAKPWQISAFCLLGAVILLSALFLHVLADTASDQQQQQQQQQNREQQHYNYHNYYHRNNGHHHHNGRRGGRHSHSHSHRSSSSSCTASNKEHHKVTKRKKYDWSDDDDDDDGHEDSLLSESLRGGGYRAEPEDDSSPRPHHHHHPEAHHQALPDAGATLLYYPYQQASHHHQPAAVSRLQHRKNTTSGGVAAAATTMSGTTGATANGSGGAGGGGGGGAIPAVVVGSTTSAVAAGGAGGSFQHRNYYAPVAAAAASVTPANNMDAFVKSPSAAAAAAATSRTPVGTGRSTTSVVGNNLLPLSSSSGHNNRASTAVTPNNNATTTSRLPTIADADNNSTASTNFSSSGFPSYRSEDFDTTAAAEQELDLLHGQLQPPSTPATPAAPQQQLRETKNNSHHAATANDSLQQQHASIIIRKPSHDSDKLQKNYVTVKTPTFPAPPPPPPPRDANKGTTPVSAAAVTAQPKNNTNSTPPNNVNRIASRTPEDEKIASTFGGAKGQGLCRTGNSKTSLPPHHGEQDVVAEQTPRVNNRRPVIQGLLQQEASAGSRHGKPDKVSAVASSTTTANSTNNKSSGAPGAGAYFQTPPFAPDLIDHASDSSFPNDLLGGGPPIMPFLPSLEPGGGTNNGNHNGTKRINAGAAPSIAEPPRSIIVDDLNLYLMMESGNASPHWQAATSPLARTTADGGGPRQRRSSPESGSASSNLFHTPIPPTPPPPPAEGGTKRSSTRRAPPKVDLTAPPVELPPQSLSSSVSSVSLDDNDPRKNIIHKRPDITISTDASKSLQVAVDFSELNLVEVIGGGGFGQVWRAIWRGTPVAVKVLTGSAQSKHVPRAILEEFAAEINLLKGMRHPNICLYMGACLQPPNRAIITELAANGSLWDALRLPLTPPYSPCDGVSRDAWPLLLYRPDPVHGAPPMMTMNAHGSTPVSHVGGRMTVPPVVPKGSWPWILVKRVALGAARGMAYLHSGSPPVLHRDLKSANILLDESYTAKVCDFGLSRLKSQDRSMTGNCGTVQWMAPEVLANQSYDEKADVFSYGIICWELLTRQCPYDGMSAIQCALAVLNRNSRPEIPKWCPPAMHALIRSCVKKDPAERPSFPEILDALEAMPG